MQLTENFYTLGNTSLNLFRGSILRVDSGDIANPLGLRIGPGFALLFLL